MSNNRTINRFSLGPRARRVIRFVARFVNPIVLLVAGAISVLVASDHRVALGLYRAYFIEPVALFYVAADLLDREEHMQRLVLALAVGSSAFALINLEVFTRAVLAHDVHVGVAPNALYGNANYVAMYLEPPFALAAGLLLLGHGRRWKLVGAIWLAIVGAALVAMMVTAALSLAWTNRLP